MYFIYVLCDPRDTRVRYVGCSMNPAKRVRREVWLCANRSGKTSRWCPNQRWIRELLAAGLQPVMHVVERSESAADASQLEADWMARLREKGASLLNVHRRGYSRWGWERQASARATRHRTGLKFYLAGDEDDVATSMRAVAAAFAAAATS